MPGERSARMIDIAARAAARVARRAALVNDYYAPPTPQAEALGLTLERYMEHYQQFGHLAPHEGCTDAVCQEAAMMFQQAMAAMQQTGPTNGNQ